MKHAQPSGSEAGHFTVIDLSPKGGEMISVSSVARLGADLPKRRLAGLQMIDPGNSVATCG